MTVFKRLISSVTVIGVTKSFQCCLNTIIHYKVINVSLCFVGLLVTLWAIDRLGRRKTMALCFLVFSLCIIPLYGCVGRWCTMI